MRRWLTMFSVCLTTLMLLSCSGAGTRGIDHRPLELERGWYRQGEAWCMSEGDMRKLMVDYAILINQCRED